MRFLLRPFCLNTLVLCVLLVLCSIHAAARDGEILNALVFPRTGDGMAGEIIGVDGDSLTIVGDTVYRLARADISRIVVRTAVPKGRGFVYGVSAGLVGWNVLLSGIGGQMPFVFADMYGSYQGGGYRTSPIFLAHHTLAVTALFGGIGYAIDARRPYEDYQFAFPSGAEAEQQLAWRELRELLADSGATPVRISIASSYVVPTAGNRFSRELSASGFEIHRRKPFGYGEHLLRGEETESDDEEAALDINALRRIQVMHRIAPNMEAGLSMAWTGEPLLHATREDSIYPGEVRRYYRMRQKLSGNGYYASVLYDVGSIIHPRCNVRLGGGAGLAFRRYELEGTLWSHSAHTPPVREAEYQFSFSGVLFSAIAIAECSWRVYDHLSLGFTADYIITPSSRKIPAVPFAGLSEYSFPFGNGSVGMTLQLHL